MCQWVWIIDGAVHDASIYIFCPCPDNVSPLEPDITLHLFPGQETDQWQLELCQPLQVMNTQEIKLGLCVGDDAS